MPPTPSRPATPRYLECRDLLAFFALISRWEANPIRGHSMFRPVHTHALRQLFVALRESVLGSICVFEEDNLTVVGRGPPDERADFFQSHPSAGVVGVSPRDVQLQPGGSGGGGKSCK